MKNVEKINLADERHYDYGCVYTKGDPARGFEFIIYNKVNNSKRAKVTLDKTQMLDLMRCLDACLGDNYWTD